MSGVNLPGSGGEHWLQGQQGSLSRAHAFYTKQVLNHLNASMQEFIGQQEMVFLATADGKGECDCSFRSGEKGFIQILNERNLLYPELRGNGVYSSLGNIRENPHVALLFLDFFHHGIGLHVNGKATVWTEEELLRVHQMRPAIPAGLVSNGHRPELWVVTEVEEAYIHCSKHIPMLARLPKEFEWGTDDVKKKGGDFFHAKECSRPWVEQSSPL
jgi:uncharacterized protein